MLQRILKNIDKLPNKTINPTGRYNAAQLVIVIVGFQSVRLNGFKRMKCIYCLEDKPPSLFGKVEHVIPQSFGLFLNNFTLHNIVCDKCNKYFGDFLEIFLARDTFEGASRFEFEMKAAKDFKSLGKRSRMKIKIAEGERKGAYVYREYSKEQGKLVIKPLPQIGFLKNDSAEYEYFLLDQIPFKSYLDENGFNLKHSRAIRSFGVDVPTISKVLSEKGIKFQFKGEMSPSEDPKDDLLCEAESLIDSTIYRTVAKIAFNYLAYWEGRDFMLNQCFDSTRSFILYGKKDEGPFVQVNDTPILGDEPVEGRRRVGHIVTVNWAIDKVSIVSQISLCNWASYSISLAKNFSAERRNIRRGHFFNVNGGEIFELEARSL